MTLSLAERLQSFAQAIPERVQPELSGRLTRMVGLTLEALAAP